MRHSKRSRKRRRKDRDQSRTHTARVSQAEGNGVTEVRSATVEAPARLGRLKDAGLQPCKLSTLNGEVEISMDGAIHCIVLAIVAVHVKVLAKR
jgi:hypothetical protein